MNLASLILGVLIIGAVLVGWFKMRQAIRGGSDGIEWWPRKKNKAGRRDGSLEEFISAYRRGEASVTGAGPVAAAPVATPSATADAAPARRDPFLSGPVKLAYYVCKAGLRDHHVFAHVPLTVLSADNAAPVCANIDLLVCNTEMSVVAAIDVIGADGVAADPVKSDFIRSLGIRYLRLSVKSLPKAEEIRGLLYRM